MNGYINSDLEMVHTFVQRVISIWLQKEILETDKYGMER
jgi:hypothetical protein